MSASPALAPLPEVPGPTRDSVRRVLPAVAVAILSATLLFWNIGARYLWQDEASCAVLSERLLRSGKPLAYDGRNLITMDAFFRSEGPTVAQYTQSAAAGIRHFVERGDFKSDTTWIGQPWSQFVATAGSFALFGRGTLQARLPFALAAVATALVLFSFVRRRFASLPMASIATGLLLTNPYWILHARQCRYYALGSLFLVSTVVTYFRWQESLEARRSDRSRALLFAVVSWCFFQTDFGSFWPVMGVLLVDALVRRGRRLHAAAVFGLVALSVAAFVEYYELANRLKQPIVDLGGRLGLLAVWVDRFQLPALVPLLALALLSQRHAKWVSLEKRVVAVVLAIVLAQILWMGAVSPYPFYRYVVGATPLSCLVVAFVAVRVFERILPPSRQVVAGVAAVLAGALVALSPLPSRVLGWAFPIPDVFRAQVGDPGLWLRRELGALSADLRATHPDPNRAVIEFLRGRLAPGDEVLINYEDSPLMFYLDHPIRGGIGCFRAEDPTPPAPRFLVLRQSATFTHEEVYQREWRRHRWIQVDVDAPDVPWGNSPDPLGHYSLIEDWTGWPRIRVYENASYVYSR